MTVAAAASERKRKARGASGAASGRSARLVRPPSPPAAVAGGAGRAQPIPIGCGCRRSCCSRPPSRRWRRSMRGFSRAFPTVHALAAAPLEDVLKLWAGLGYYARARNLHACAKAVVRPAWRALSDQRGGARASLPGIGPYTAAAIAAIAFDAKASPVDGNVERVIARLYAVEQALPAAKPVIRACAAGLTPSSRARRLRPGDDGSRRHHLHAGASRPARCARGPMPARRARAATPRRFRARAKKPEGRLRRGAAFVVVRADGHLLVRTRPADAAARRHDRSADDAMEPRFRRTRARSTRRRSCAPARWRRLPGTVTPCVHPFPARTRRLHRAPVPARTRAPAGMRWVALAELAGEALPNLMRKVVAHALAATGPRPHRRAKRPLRRAKPR